MYHMYLRYKYKPEGGKQSVEIVVCISSPLGQHSIVMKPTLMQNQVGSGKHFLDLEITIPKLFGTNVSVRFLHNIDCTAKNTTDQNDGVKKKYPVKMRWYMKGGGGRCEGQSLTNDVDWWKDMYLQHVVTGNPGTEGSTH